MVGHQERSRHVIKRCGLRFEVEPHGPVTSMGVARQLRLVPRG
jgi:hypothetical protein